MENWQDALKASRIPLRMHEGIKRWIEYGVVPGNFLWQVICNDLARAVFAADDENLSLLREYVLFFHNEAPTGCWGSERTATNWSAKFGQQTKEIVYV